jgi:hypothetical protein
VRNQLGGVTTDEVSSAVITQAISQATNEVDAKKRSDASSVLVEDAKVKLAAFYAWSAVLKSGRYQLDTIREEGYDVILENYKKLAETAVNLVCTQAIFLSTDYEDE